MKNNDVLVVSDLFNKDVFYQEVKRNFSSTAEPSLIIHDVKFISPKKLKIKYLVGKVYEIKTEIIKLINMN